MEGRRVLAMIVLFMIVLVTSPSPSSCARQLTDFTPSGIRHDDIIGYSGDQVAGETSIPLEKYYGDAVAARFDKYYDARPNRQTDDDLQAFPKEWESFATNTFNVMSYGAVGNGQADDKQAFLKAWGDVCESTEETPTLVVPKGINFLLSSLVFQGPCKAASVKFQLNGNLVAPNNMNAWSNNKEKWVQFTDVQGLIINGGGQIDGQGEVWWKVCDVTACPRPTALHMNKCDGLRLSNIMHINSARNHISISSCNDVEISDIIIKAPEDSPNTDGIDIASSTNITIRESFIGTGDDCIAINSGSSHINIANLLCGPGHGISIGSLGAHGSYSTVEDVQVRNCTFRGTTNGARIKTWKGGSGYARHIIFENMIIQAAKNPIIIDQKYSDTVLTGFGTVLAQGNSVQVSDVTFRNFRGFIDGDTAVTLNCDSRIGCKEILLDQIDLTSSVPGKKVTAFCQNVQGTEVSVSPNLKCF